MPTDPQEPTSIETTDVVPTVESLAGVSENTEVKNGEIVVGDYDTDGKLIGWHKEVTNG